MEIYGNKEALQHLCEYRQNNRMPHSLLFFGDPGTGKRTLADYTAMLYFCSENNTAPCMKCSGCERAEKHIHPDVIYVDCSEMKVELLRDVLKETFGGSVEGGIRVFIFSEFQLLNRQCQNTLLMQLEEPSDRVRFILTASNKNSILPTILSRTAIVRTEPLTEEECTKALMRKDVPTEEAQKLAKTYKGNLGAALKTLDSKNAAVYFDFAGQYAETVYKGDEYKALTILQNLPQPKDDKREPVRILITEAAKIFHDALIISSGGKPCCGCNEAVSKKLAEKYSSALLNRLCEESGKFEGVVANIYFNSKITFNAFTAGIFEIIEKG